MELQYTFCDIGLGCGASWWSEKVRGSELVKRDGHQGAS